MAAPVRGQAFGGVGGRTASSCPTHGHRRPDRTGRVASLELTPANATHWSRASIAAESGLSRSTAGRLWKAFGLKPHQVDPFELLDDPQFIDKVS